MSDTTGAPAAVYALLKASPALVALVGDRIYPRLAPAGTPYPLLTYEEVTGVMEGVVPPNLWTSRIQLTAIADTYAQAKQILRTAVGACHLQRGTFGGVQVASIVHDAIGADDYDVGTMKFEQSSDLRVTYLDDGS